MLRARKIEISTGSKHIAIIHTLDMERLHLRALDRVEVRSKRKKKTIICTVDQLNLASEQDDKDIHLKPGEIGLSDEAFHALKLADGDPVQLRTVLPPLSFSYVKAKMKGKAFTKKAFYEVINDIVSGYYTSIEIAFFLFVCEVRGLSVTEILYLTQAMVDTGKSLPHVYKVMADKHSIGGVPGNRTTPIVVSILASLGVPMLSNFTRAITSPSGTADTLEPYINVHIDIARIKLALRKNNGCFVWLGNQGFAPADHILIQAERQLGLNSQGIMLASIFAKKKAVGITDLLLEIPYGPSCKVLNKSQAVNLRNKAQYIARSLHMKLVAYLVPTSEPTGRGIGPILEFSDVLSVLENKNYPKDLFDKSVTEATLLYAHITNQSKAKSKKQCLEALTSGRAKESFEAIRKMQGRPREELSLNTKCVKVYAEKSGRISGISIVKINDLARYIGLPHDRNAGLYIHKKNRDYVKKGDLLLSVYVYDQLLARQVTSYIDGNKNIFTVK